MSPLSQQLRLPPAPSAMHCPGSLCSSVHTALRPLLCPVNSDSSGTNLGQAPLAPRRDERCLPAPSPLQDGSTAGSHCLVSQIVASSLLYHQAVSISKTMMMDYEEPSQLCTPGKNQAGADSIYLKWRPHANCCLPG